MELTHTLHRNADGSYTAMILIGILRGQKITLPTLMEADEKAADFITAADKLAKKVRAYAPQEHHG